MKLILNKMEVQELALWGHWYRGKQEECGLRFDSGQIKLLEKIKKIKEKSK